MNIQLTDSQKIKIASSDDLYKIMQHIFLREQKIDRDREHLWVVSLNLKNKVLNIELVSMGTVNKTIIEPMEVFSVPLQKRASGIILVHNHPSGELQPSESDIDITDLLIQGGRLIKTPVIDHMIISENSYYSFNDHGLMEKLYLSEKYVTNYELKERYAKQGQEAGERKGQKEKAIEMARTMKKRGYDIEEIATITGLSKRSILNLKTES